MVGRYFVAAVKIGTLVYPELHNVSHRSLPTTSSFISYAPHSNQAPLHRCPIEYVVDGLSAGFGDDRYSNYDDILSTPARPVGVTVMMSGDSQLHA